MPKARSTDIDFQQWPGSLPPDVSPAGAGRIYFDSATNTFKISQNGGPYFQGSQLETSELILLPEGRVIAQSTRVLQANFDGASIIVRRATSLSRVIFRLTAAVLPATVRVLLFQTSSGGSGIANRIASATVALAVAGAQTQTVIFAEGTVPIKEGILYALFGRSAGAGSGTMRTYATSNYDLLTSNVDNNTHPTMFTTAILSSALPATFNPLPVAGGGQATPAALDLCPVLRLRA